MTRNELKKHLLRDIHKSSYFEFFKWAWDTIVPEPYVHNWHIELICNELQAVGERVAARQEKLYDLVINLSPGESKSTICTILFPVWLWTIDPTLRIITGSYSSTIGIKLAVKSRDCIASSKFQSLYGNIVKIRRDIDSKTLYATEAGGERYVTSTGASATGNHGHIIINDDPLNAQKAASAAELETAGHWVSNTMPTRVVDKKIAPTILIMQRLHEKDPTQIMLSKGKVRHICLPAENTYPIYPSEFEQYYVDGLMNPSRTDRSVLADMQAKLGSTAYAGQFGQQPSSPDGGVIKRKWWQYYDAKDMPNNLTWDMWVDGAYTKSVSNDPTGIMVAGYDRAKNRLYIRHAEAARMEMPDLLRRIPEIAAQHGLTSRSRCYIEPKASGKSLKQMLREQNIVSPVEISSPLVSEGKEARIQVSAPRVESGSVFLLDHPNTEIIVYENAEFPKSEHDEFVDLLGYACSHYFSKTSVKRGSAAV